MDWNAGDDVYVFSFKYSIDIRSFDYSVTRQILTIYRVNFFGINIPNKVISGVFQCKII